MSKLAIYIDFSIKYKIIFGNRDLFPIKEIIWKYYLYSVMSDKIKALIKRNIHHCSDCGRADWAFFVGQNQKFYGVDACYNGCSYATDVPCCMKYICLRNQCRLKCVCEECGYIDFITQISRQEDRGWNALEGKQTINYSCGNCGEENIRKLTWNHNCIESCALGKLV
jgi:hypothetical protein